MPMVFFSKHKRLIQLILIVWLLLPCLAVATTPPPPPKQANTQTQQQAEQIEKLQAELEALKYELVRGQAKHDALKEFLGDELQKEIEKAKEKDDDHTQKIADNTAWINSGKWVAGILFTFIMALLSVGYLGYKKFINDVKEVATKRVESEVKSLMDSKKYEFEEIKDKFESQSEKDFDAYRKGLTRILDQSKQEAKTKVDSMLTDFGKMEKPKNLPADATEKQKKAKNYLTDAFDAYKNGLYEVAINYASKAIDLDPQYAEAYNIRAVNYSMLQRNKEALADFTKAIELNPQYAEVYFNRGILYAKQKEFYKALADYNKAIELNPNGAEAYYNRGILYAKQKEFNKALADYNQTIILNPQYTEPYNNRGNLYIEQKEYDKALADYNKAIELNPQYAEAYFNRGNLYYKQKEYDKALADFTKAINRNPQYAEAYYNRGTLFIEKKEYDKALADYNKAIELNPNGAQAYNNRGNLYYKQKEYDKALADYNKAIDLNPKDADAYNNRAVNYSMLQRYNEALADYDQAIELNPQYAEAYNNRGDIYFGQKEFDKALADFTKAIKLNPTGIAIIVNILEVKLIAEQPPKEIEAFFKEHNETILLQENDVLKAAWAFMGYLLQRQLGNQPLAQQHQQRFTQLTNQPNFKQINTFGFNHFKEWIPQTKKLTQPQKQEAHDLIKAL